MIVNGIVQRIVHRGLPQLMARAQGRGFIGSVLMLAGGTALGQAVVVLASPILTRLYTPTDLGLLGLFTAFMSVAGVAATLRYEGAIVAARDEEEAFYLIVGSIGATIISSAVLCLGFYAMIQYDVFNFGSLPAWSALLAYPALVLTALFAILRYWFLRQRSFSIVTRVSIVQNIARAITQIIFGILNFGWLGLSLGDLAGRASGNGRMLQLAWPAFRSELDRIRLATLFSVLKAHYHYPVYNLPSSIINALVTSLPIPLIAQFYGPAAAGYFALVQRVLSLPAALIGRSVADAFHAHLVVYVRTRPQATQSFFLRTAGGLFLIGIGPTVLLALFGPQFFATIFGPTWTIAGLLAAATAPWALAQLIVSPLSRVVLVLGGQETKLLYDFAGLAAVVIGVVGGYQFGFSLSEAVALLNWLQVLAYGVYFLILWRAVSTFQQKNQPPTSSTAD